MSKFVCAWCGRSSSVLSQHSYELAGTWSVRLAKELLDADDLLCPACDDALADDDVELPVWSARTELESWELSGVQVDPAKLQAYYLNY